ncbi:putative hydroxymethylglutaryl-CoA synthase [Aspergillus ellipticus CBS 707.79]|uniref:Hydroxymethylglutaryl-CoA synthase n=1 Tax=Aspergillus ellipticus CBS 707.79 TaxID=1448320 RepID=A0A319CSR1_9EURO|nr:putative hydroxymethylglutaryl-CoA synthase [Aspergillus ellipticus CBS 707.79]
MPPTHPTNIGIKAIELYFPPQTLTQTALEIHDSTSPGKYTIGHGQQQMSFCSDREDITSMCLTVFSSLLQKYSIPATSIGRLEVGTESPSDRSKSIKSVLMQLLTAHGNTNVEGADTINACYGGTNALFNSVNWIESSAWDGRDAVVVTGDIALYERGAARPTGGAGCVAMLVGPGAPIVLEPGLRGSFSRHVWDFYKPDGRTEYPVINGKFSVRCYLEALDASYKAYLERERQVSGVDVREQDGLAVDRFDYMLFHSPTCKVVQKAFARLLFNDYLARPEHPFFEGVPEKFREMGYEESLEDKELMKVFVGLAEERFRRRVAPSLEVASLCGNMYTASLYGCLISFIDNVRFDGASKRVGMFSYGSGLVSSMFSVRVVGDVSDMAAKVDLKARLKARRVVSPDVYEKVCQLREQAYMTRDYLPFTSTDDLVDGTYYLSCVNDKFEREYTAKA